MKDKPISFSHPDTIDWHYIESCSEVTCFHTSQWVNHIVSCGYQPYIIAIYQNDLIGYFVGVLYGRFVKMIFAPLNSFGYVQGIVSHLHLSYVQRANLYKALSKWVFDNRVASYFSVDDWNLRECNVRWIDPITYKNEILEDLKIKYTMRPTLYLAIKGRTEEDLWNKMSYTAARYRINKALKMGLHASIITEAKDISSFVEKHYQHLCDVTKRHRAGLPRLAQSKYRLLSVCQSLFPNNVLMIQILGKDKSEGDVVMSSAIFIICAGMCHYYTGASFHRYFKFSPNELMVWEAIKILQKRNVSSLNFGGCADYKLKFGTEYAYIPRMIFSKNKIFDTMTKTIKLLYNRFSVFKRLTLILQRIHLFR